MTSNAAVLELPRLRLKTRGAGGAGRTVKAASLSQVRALQWGYRACPGLSRGARLKQDEGRGVE